MVSEEEISLFLGETNGLITKIEEDIIKLEKNPGNSKPIQELFYVFNGLTRIIKILNLDNVTKFSYDIEKILEKANNTGVAENRIDQFINIMFDNLGILKLFIDNVKKGEIKDFETEYYDELRRNFDAFER
ncbi:unnamed protein product, partial [marine sediment metagenome]